MTQHRFLRTGIAKLHLPQFDLTITLGWGDGGFRVDDFRVGGEYFLDAFS